MVRRAGVALGLGALTVTCVAGNAAGQPVTAATSSIVGLAAPVMEAVSQVTALTTGDAPGAAAAAEQNAANAAASADQAAKAASEKAAADKAAADKAAADKAAADKAAADKAAADQAAAEAAANTPVNDPAAAQAYAASAIGAYGWDASQLTCLQTLWVKESDWLTGATNPSSGAYGIPQSLPADKMASAGADWKVNYKTQINWGLDYIKSSYGTPCGALQFHLGNNWY